MSFLDRLQKKSTDPMAEVSATTVAYLREQNLKFQKYMYEKLQELEGAVAQEQHRLSDTPPEDQGAASGDDFTDYPPGNDDFEPAEAEPRISLEESVVLTGLEAGEADEAAADAQPIADMQPAAEANEVPVESETDVDPDAGSVEAEVPPETETAPSPPAEQAPPSWENLLGLAEPETPAAAAEPAQGAMETELSSVEAEVSPTEAEILAEKTDFVPQTDDETEAVAGEAWGSEDEAEETARQPEAAPDESEPEAEAAAMLIMAVDPVPDDPQPAAGEILQPAAPEPDAGGSLLWDWRSPAEQPDEDTTQPAMVSLLDPVWDPDGTEDEADRETVERDGEISGTGEDAAGNVDEVAGEPDTDSDDDIDPEPQETVVNLLADEDELESGLVMPLPDDVGAWS